MFADDPANFHATHYVGTGFALDTPLGRTDAQAIAVVAGDSFALQYTSGLDKHLKESGEMIAGVFQPGCVLSGNAMAKLAGNHLPFVLAESWEGHKGMIADRKGGCGTFVSRRI
ncbi:hypothetical protein ACIQSO_20765 [Pseudomonas putida]|uniref:hypothetical protein n=1 Tax=Pseudomonas putida TaxID=303 RepID=UPI00383A5A08